MNSKKVRNARLNVEMNLGYFSLSISSYFFLYLFLLQYFESFLHEYAKTNSFVTVDGKSVYSVVYC